jgi:hypothetical protein
MTKRDYELIASAIATLPRVLVLKPDEREAIARHVARALLGTNPHFDTERFVRACTGADERPHARERRKASLRAGRERVRSVLGGNAVTFGTLQPDGALTGVRQIKQSDLRACPFSILAAEHYREDGTCKCSDPEHRAMMIREWGYKPGDFKRVGLT